LKPRMYRKPTRRISRDGCTGTSGKVKRET
jgi:hypothetical protein